MGLITVITCGFWKNELSGRLTASLNLSVSIKAVESGHIDVLMYPVNPAFDALAGEVAWLDGREDRLSGPNRSRMDLYQSCARNGVGIIAMKPYSGRIKGPLPVQRRKKGEYVRCTEVVSSHVFSYPRQGGADGPLLWLLQ
ncbi:MAG: hypothetical protein JRJ45_09120 [Deltaproteobacteria bacterium]|nr:hypothetical protein [Deltaproteobacteria bacterium]